MWENHPWHSLLFVYKHWPRLPWSTFSLACNKRCSSENAVVSDRLGWKRGSLCTFLDRDTQWEMQMEASYLGSIASPLFFAKRNTVWQRFSKAAELSEKDRILWNKEEAVGKRSFGEQRNSLNNLILLRASNIEHKLFKCTGESVFWKLGVCIKILYFIYCCVIN